MMWMDAVDACMGLAIQAQIVNLNQIASYGSIAVGMSLQATITP